MGDFCYLFFLLPPQIRCSIQTHHHLKTQIIKSIGRILSHNFNIAFCVFIYLIIRVLNLFRTGAEPDVPWQLQSQSMDLVSCLNGDISSIGPKMSIASKNWVEAECFWNVFLSLTFWTARKCFPVNCAFLRKFCTQSCGRGTPPLAENEQILFFSYNSSDMGQDQQCWKSEFTFGWTSWKLWPGK